MRSDFPGLLVEPGEIQLHYALLVVDDQHAKAWNVDLHSKYAQVLSCDYDDDGRPQVLVYAVGRTLRLNESLRGMPTRITLTSLNDSWQLMAECLRYTLRIVAYLPKPN